MTLTVALPAGLDFVSARSDRGTATFADGAVTADIGMLLPDQSAVVTIRAIPRAAGVDRQHRLGSADQADPAAQDNAGERPPSTSSRRSRPTSP